MSTYMQVRELDKLCDTLGDANLLGFMRRLPESKYYRAPPSGSTDYVTPATIERTLASARMALRVQS